MSGEVSHSGGSRFRQLEIQTPSARARELCAQARERLGCSELQEAIALCDQAIEEDEHCASALRLKALAMRACGLFSEAVVAFQGYLCNATPDGSDWLEYGQVLLAAGDLSAAEESFARALAADPDRAEARLHHARVLLARGDSRRALPAFSEVLAGSPMEVPAWVGKGACLSLQGDQEGALACYDRALAIRESDQDALYNKALVLAELRRWAEAEATSRRLLALRPSDAEAVATYGEALLGLGRLDDAISVSDRAIAVDGARVRPWVTKALALAAAGQLVAAEAACRDGLSLDPAQAALAGLSGRIRALHAELVAPAEQAVAQARASKSRADAEASRAEHALRDARRSRASHRQRVMNESIWKHSPEGRVAIAIGVPMYMILMLTAGQAANRLHSLGGALFVVFGIPLVVWLLVKVGGGVVLQSLHAAGGSGDPQELAAALRDAQVRARDAAAGLDVAEKRLAEAQTRFAAARVPVA